MTTTVTGGADGVGAGTVELDESAQDAASFRRCEPLYTEPSAEATGVVRLGGRPRLRVGTGKSVHARALLTRVVEGWGAWVLPHTRTWLTRVVE